MNEKLLQQILDALNESNRVQSEIVRNQMALRGVFEAIDRRFTTLEEALEVVALDAAQAREHGHHIRNVISALSVCTEHLVDIADGKSRSSDTLQAARRHLTDILDGQR